MDGGEECREEEGEGRGRWGRVWNGREEGRSKATTVGFYGAITRNWLSLLRQQEYDAGGSISFGIVCLCVSYKSINYRDIQAKFTWINKEKQIEAC